MFTHSHRCLYMQAWEPRFLNPFLSITSVSIYACSDRREEAPGPVRGHGGTGFSKDDLFHSDRCRRQERLVVTCLPLPGGDRLPPCCEHPFPGLPWINLWIHSDPSCYASGIDTNVFLQTTHWIRPCFGVDDHVLIRLGSIYHVQTLVKEAAAEWRDNFYHLFIHIYESIFARILVTTFAIIFVNDLSTIVWLRHRWPSSPPLISFCVLMEQLVHHASSVVSPPAVILTLLDITTSSVNVSYPIVGFCLPSFYLLVFF
jgi:hypothetical protein